MRGIIARGAQGPRPLPFCQRPRPRLWIAPNRYFARCLTDSPAASNYLFAFTLTPEPATMRPIGIALCTLFVAGCAGNSQLEGERVTVDNGVVSVCGEGNGLPECRDYNNLTYGENLEYTAPTDAQM